MKFSKPNICTYICVCIYIYVCVYIYICMCVCIYIYKTALPFYILIGINEDLEG